MEIHAPDKPIHSFRDFLIHIATITTGILIALSLEAMIEWSHHRTLVREAKANLRTEMQNNRAELDKVLKGMPKFEKDRENALNLIEDLLTKKKSEVRQVSLDYQLMTFTSASYTTAQTTGAFGFMKYPEVQRYAELYSLQSKLDKMQDRTLELVISSIPLSEPEKMSQKELGDWKQGIRSSLAFLRSEQQVAKSLRDELDKDLSATGEQHR